jgi:microcystin-dependent protein
MDIKVLDSALNFKAIIDNYESCYCILIHGGMSHASITIQSDKNNVGLLTKGSYFYVGDDTKHLFYISENPKSFSRKGSYTQITAYDVFWLFNGRLSNDTDAPIDDSTHTVETIIQTYIDRALINPADPDRAIPYIGLATNQHRGTTISAIANQTPLGDDIVKLLNIDHMGLYGEYDSTNKKIIIDVYEGTDRSADNGVNPPVIFDVKFNNVQSAETKDSITAVKNFAYVGGISSTTGLRVIRKVGTATGVDRREIFVDAGKTDDSAVMDAAGLAAMIETEKAISVGIDALKGSFVYGVDYFLGDIVTIIDNDLRLLEVDRVFEKGKPEQLNFIFGQIEQTIETQVSNNTSRIAALETKVVGNTTIENTVADMTPVGAISAWAGATAPDGYLLCDGALKSRETYAELFAVIGTTYGAGDGSTTFALPDLKRRVIVGKDSAAPFNALGNYGGEETHVLSVAELAAHGHTLSGSVSADSGGAHTHSLTGDSGAQSQDHTHNVNPDSFTVSGGSHTHTVPDAGVNIRNYYTLDGSSGAAYSTYDVSIASSGSHSHTVNVPDTTSTGVSQGHTHDLSSGSAAEGGAHTHTCTVSLSVDNAGSNTGHNNLQPYIVLNYIIKHCTTEITGKQVELQRSASYIQWKYKDEEDWSNLIEVAELEAPHTVIQYSSNGTSWHDTCTAGDKYIHFSVDGGATYGAAMYLGENVLPAFTANRVLVSDGSGNVAASAVTDTQLGYLSDVTSNIQAQIDGKQAEITVTANRALVSDGDGKVAASSITDTKLGYLSDVTSNIQAQMDGKMAGAASSGENNIVVFADSNGKTARNSDINIYDLLNGWIPASHVWTRTGDYTFTVPGDATGSYQAKDKFKLSQDDGVTFKYGYIVKVVFSVDTTTITISQENTLTASAISNTYISKIQTPHAFPYGKALLWSGAWSTGNITVPGMGNFDKYIIAMDGQGTVIDAYQLPSVDTTYIRGMGGYAAAAVGTSYHLGATLSGDVLTFVRCFSVQHTESGSHSAYTNRTVSQIYGLI